jgi:hypothetical protein
MTTTRRDALKMGVALSAVPLVGGFEAKAAASAGTKFFSTGVADLDATLGGGMRDATFLAVVGPRGSGKTAFLLNLAKANGLIDAHSMNAGGSDMLSIMARTDGTHVGSLMLDAAEPSTDKEKQDMAADPAARHEFLSRWFRRTHEIVQESGGIFVISAWGTQGDPSTAAWMAYPDYVVRADNGAYSLIKSPSPK